ncbi:TolC family protein [Prevotella sp. OH937_COT-195]|uniref:TolC family protein n=1 Tax=Prevotella sp. OH937_COT-195 TaxID=2491051 RepID=UPI000F654105|nr:TolC family protein [Prevotella sp. OH937_COT-195]RRD02930.1 TolC family protein [Prevotella sp. OH937_COT-195]
MRLTFFALLIFGIVSATSAQETKKWTMQECIDYALQNNIQIKKSKIKKLSVHEDVLQSQAEMLPSLTAHTSQNMTYRPWPETGSATVANGYVQTSIDKVFYNGSYGINANWTVWNGKRNTNTIKQNKINEEMAELDSAITANNIHEQIVQLYVQIVYSNEAISVNKDNLETCRANEERGKTMVDVGKMSKADLAQLTAQRAQAEYNVVEAETNVRNYKRQLKQLLQLTDTTFDVEIPETTDEMALEEIPALNNIYQKALASRPEIKNAILGINSSDISIRLAKAQRMPSVSLNASFITNTTSMSDNGWGMQMKNNFNLGAGVTVSIPISDNRQTRTAINKALLQQQDYILELENKTTNLYSTIEDYWLQAESNQNRFKAAKAGTESAKASFDLLQEQFRLGLKNIVELMNGRDKLLTARQNELQSKFLTIFNIAMLKFYRGNL